MKMRKNVYVFAMLLAVGLITPALASAQAQNFLIKKFPDPKREDHKMVFLRRSSDIYFIGGTLLDGATTMKGMSDHGVETGWAKCFGNRNTFAAVGANAGKNALVFWLSHKLEQRGGKWRYAAAAARFYVGTQSMQAGFHNIRYSMGR